MAVPKRRHSKTRRNKRRGQWKISAPTTVACSHCGEPKRLHRICPHCGHYKGEEVLLVKS
ncbi:MAG: 50S ribosomal protein L32 [Candidatus Eisenbacteria sp.]|nr:50S ribosomal protein L32 [Candidatus Eisenbacteria bacterium]